MGYFMNSIIMGKTSKASKLYDYLGNFDSTETLKNSSKSYKPITEFKDSGIILSIMQILAKMPVNTEREISSITASLAKMARISEFKSKDSNSVSREFIDYKVIATHDKIISAINYLMAYTDMKFAYRFTEKGILHVTTRQGLLSVSLHENCIRQSEETGEFYLSSVRKFVSKVESETFKKVLLSTIDAKEYAEQIELEISSNAEFADTIFSEIQRKIELKKTWKELTAREISEDIDAEIDAEKIVNE